jgi:hypothetical protein
LFLIGATDDKVGLRSQEEYLWAPCSFLEPSGEAVVEAVGDSGDGGVVTVVPVRAAFTDTDASYQ